MSKIKSPTQYLHAKNENKISKKQNTESNKT